jgi:hypothetical protein
MFPSSCPVVTRLSALSFREGSFNFRGVDHDKGRLVRHRAARLLANRGQDPADQQPADRYAADYSFGFIATDFEILVGSFITVYNVSAQLETGLASTDNYVWVCVRLCS